MTDRPGLHSLRDILPVSGTMYLVEQVGASCSVEIRESTTNGRCIDQYIPNIDDLCCRGTVLVMDLYA